MKLMAGGLIRRSDLERAVACVTCAWTDEGRARGRACRKRERNRNLQMGWLVGLPSLGAGWVVGSALQLRADRMVTVERLPRKTVGVGGRFRFRLPSSSAAR